MYFFKSKSLFFLNEKEFKHIHANPAIDCHDTQSKIIEKKVSSQLKKVNAKKLARSSAK